MATWKDLYQLMIEPGVTPSQVVARLKVKPYRFAQLMNCRRLSQRLAMDREVAQAQASRSAQEAVAIMAGWPRAQTAESLETRSRGQRK